MEANNLETVLVKRDSEKIVGKLKRNREKT